MNKTEKVVLRSILYGAILLGFVLASSFIAGQAFQGLSGAERAEPEGFLGVGAVAAGPIG